MNDHLEEQTNDFKRFATVLNSKKHFDLVSEKQIRKAKIRWSAETEPQLKQLIYRAQEALQRDRKNCKTLKTQVSA